MIPHAEAKQLGAELAERYRQLDEARAASVKDGYAKARERAHPCARAILGLLDHQYMPVPPEFRTYRCRTCGAETEG
jgi:hypothetical protein